MQMITKVNHVLETSEYSQFKKILGNRQLDLLHVKKLKQSLSEQDLMIPIVVNEKREVIDGQHRLKAREELGLPVYYLVVDGLGINETQRANLTNKTWTLDDFLNTYVELNYHHYKVYKQFKERWKLSNSECIALLSGKLYGAHGEGHKDFQSGLFGVNDLDWANDVAAKIYRVEPFYSGFKRRSFIFALIHVISTEGFDFEEFIQKLSYQSSKMVHCTNKSQYLRIIEDIYNYKRQADGKIRFS